MTKPTDRDFFSQVLVLDVLAFGFLSLYFMALLLYTPLAFSSIIIWLCYIIVWFLFKITRIYCTLIRLPFSLLFLYLIGL
jgi:hypothetical protein